MKKDYLEKWLILVHAFSNPVFIKRMSGLLMILCLFQSPVLQARDTVDNTLVTLSVSNEPIKNVFHLVENQTGMTFFYLDKQVDVERTITLSLSNVALEKALQLLFENTPIAYNITGKQIVLKKHARKELRSTIDTAPLKENIVTIPSDVIHAPSISVVNNVPLAILVKGRITSETGEALPGVNVVEKGTTNGTNTDVDGNYSLNVASESSILVFSFIGYTAQEISVGTQTNVSVALMPDIQTLSEIVVIGYGTQEKRTLTGAVASISTQEITQAKTLNFMDALQGRAPGVQVQSTSGTPGAPTNIKIRGVSSINSDTDPLWVIDGMPVFTDNIGRTSATVAQNPMASINPNDIESIEILKDAAATAIYGSRGSNGVIIVTTKTGKGKGSVTVDYSSGISQLSKSVEDAGHANTQEWIAILDQALANSNKGEFTPAYMLNANFLTPITREQALATQSDWAKQGLRKGSFNDVNISFAQGNEKSNLFTSLNYRKDKGVNVGNDLSRVSGRINLELTPIKRLKLGTRFSLSYLENYRTKEANGNPGGNAGSVGSFAAIVKSALPWYPIYDTDDPSGFWNPGAGNAALANRRDLLLDKREQYRALGNVYAEYDIPGIEGLAIRGEGSFDIIQDNATNWASAFVNNNKKSFAYEGSVFAQSVNYNALLKYNRSFSGDVHRINFVGGTESQGRSNYTRAIEGLDVVGYNQEIGEANPSAIVTAQGFRHGERYLRSYFARADYQFHNRYLFGASVRRDGSSAFAKDYRWGTFYALSGGWIVSEERFFDKFNNTVNFLKLRASYGETGNQSIPNNENITYLSNESKNRYGPVAPAGTTYNVGNPPLTWESTNSYNIGADARFLNDRFSASAEYYMQKVTDMLLKVSVPYSSGINAVYDNVGDMDNYGWEFTLSSVNIKKNNFEWTTSLNFSTNHNKIQRLTPELDRQRGNKLFVGGSLGLFKMSDYAGIDPERGVHMIHEFDYALYLETGEYVYTGRLIPATDSNTRLQQVVFADKSSIPTYFGGISNSFTYKGFDLNVFFNFSGGNWIYNDYERQVTNVANGYWNKKRDMLTESWVPGKTDAKYPLLFVEGGAPATTKWDANAIDPNTGLLGWWRNPDINNLVDPAAQETYDKNGGNQLSKNLERGDYLRLKTISLGYTFPSAFLGTKYVQKLRVYFTANNIWTLTGYTGWDPESGNTYLTPVTKNFAAGISASF